MSQEIINTLKSPADWIRWAVSQFKKNNLFFGQGTENALDEAAWLVLGGLNLPNDLPAPYLHATLLIEERERVFNLLEKRINNHTPTAYLLGEAWWMGLRFEVDERVLIPRSPIAELLQNRLKPWLNFEPKTILDLCTGSGCIAIGAAHVFPNAEIDALDISPDALIVAQKNINNFNLNDQINLIQSNLFEKIKNKKYDLIITNPPYVSESEYNALPKEYYHEPKLALECAQDGLLIPLNIIENAANYLNPKGYLVMDVGGTWQALDAACQDLPLTWCDMEHGGDGICIIQGQDLPRV